MRHLETELAITDSRLDAFLDSVGPRDAFEALAALLPDAAVFAVDAERNVLLWSDGAERVLGFPRAEVLGRLCLGGIRCRNCMIGCGLAEHGHIEGVALEHYRRDGQVVAVRKYAKAFRDAQGRFAGGIEVLVPEGAAFSPEPCWPGLPDDAELFHGLVSRHPKMKRVFETVRLAAETDASVLVSGESGTGKEGIARAVHEESHRRRGPFVAVSCASLTPTLIESELFGHQRGAFTGAVSDRQGVFARAHGGTLFLDEIAELPLDLQAKLLRALETRAIVPVGASREVDVDVRVVAATHRALDAQVRIGAFRDDLMYRLLVVPISLPPLRERGGDVELLVHHFCEDFNARGPRRVARVAPEAMRALLDHPWPGNVRELRNAIEYAFAVGRGPELRRDELPPVLRGEDARSEEGPRSEPGPVSTDGARPLLPPASEIERLRWALDRCDGHVGRAAALLGMSRATFWRKRRRCAGSGSQ